MKWTFVWIFLFCMQVSAKVYSQGDAKLSLKARDVKLGKALSLIERQSDYRFFFNNREVPVDEKVSLNISDASIDVLLKRLLPGNLRYKILKNKVVLISPLDHLTEAIPIEGTVQDMKGNPLIGVSVKIKGGSNGTVTDQNGHFELDTQESDTLVLSYIGYQTLEMPITGNHPLKITMQESASNLNEVVVVGYGTQKKLDLTGAVDQVSGEVLENRPITSVEQGLQGVIPNLNITTTYNGGGAPGAAMNINIRGYTGLGSQTNTTTDAPLILIDGVPGDINSINPLDIESVSVLKDAASAAIYGSRAPYGVILITTKKGKKGKIQVAASSNFSFSQPIHLPEMLSSVQFAELYNEAAENAGQPHPFSDATVQRMKDYLKNPRSVPATIPDPTNPNIWGGWFYANADNDWFKIYFKDWAASQQHNVSVTGGSGSTIYYLGLGYTGKTGMYNFGDDKYKRYNIRANITSDVTKWLNLSFRSAFARSNWNSPNTYASKTGGNYMHQIARKWPNLPLLNPDGHYSFFNDIALHKSGGRNIDNLNDINLTGEVVVKPLPGWEITGNYNIRYQVDDYQAEQKIVYAYHVDGTPYAQTPVPDQVYKYVDLTDYSSANIYTSYEKSAGRHYFKALVGYQSELNKFRDLSGSNTNLYDPELPALSLTYGTSPALSDALYEWATEGIFMRFNYNYNDKYLLEFNGRYDGSSKFAPEQRWDFFPSVSAGYNIFKEPFWKQVSRYINTLKIRGSYGALGDNNVGNYAYLSTLITAAPQNSNWIFGGSQQLPYVRQPGALISPSITWAKPSMLDFGADVTFLRDRLSLTYDWYRRKTVDLIGPARAYPAGLGANAPQENNAAIETRGFELSLGWRDRIRGFSYNARFVLSDYTGKVLAYPNPEGLLNTWYSGEQIGAIWGYETAGLFQSDDAVAKAPSQTKLAANWYAGDVQYKDLNGDGIVSPGSNTLDDPGDRIVIGNNTPRYNYGFSFNGKWKNLDFSFFLQGVGKRDFFTSSNYFWGIIGDQYQNTGLVQDLDRWSRDNPNGYFPRFYLSGQMGKNIHPQTRYLQSAAYMRLKNFQLGYSLPSKWLERAKIQQLHFYISAENVFTITKLQKSFDPEAAVSDAKVYPLQRTFSVGLNLSL